MDEIVAPKKTISKSSEFKSKFSAFSSVESTSSEHDITVERSRSARIHEYNSSSCPFTYVTSESRLSKSENEVLPGVYFKSSDLDLKLSNVSPSSEWLQSLHYNWVKPTRTFTGRKPPPKYVLSLKCNILKQMTTDTN